MDWVLPTDENLAVAKAAEYKEHNVARLPQADHGGEHGLTSQLHSFAMHFRRSA
jgi:hypothetical protein